MANGNVPIFDLVCSTRRGGQIAGTGVVHEPGRVAQAFWRIDLAGFAGTDSVAPLLDRFANILASAGTGIRVVASIDYGINIGIDFAVTKGGYGAYYVQRGEAF